MIEMRDASPQLIDMFESRFFPSLGKDQAVASHIAAGEKARSEGNAELAKVHFGYAEALRNDKVNLDVDIDAAMKALNQRDYAGFVAKGVKVASSKNVGTSDYVRVITKDVDEGSRVTWTAVQVTSKQRVVTQFLEPEKEEYQAFIGVCHGFPYAANTAFGQVKGFVPTCLVQGGPAARADIRLGEFLGRINGRQIDTVDDLADALRGVDPGESIEVERLTWQQPFNQPGRFVRSTVNVRTGRRPAD
jgi:hypothetical protein